MRLVSPTEARAAGGDGRGGEGWQPLPVTEIEVGEALLLREATQGTHVGRPIDAAVNES